LNITRKDAKTRSKTQRVERRENTTTKNSGQLGGRDWKTLFLSQNSWEVKKVEAKGTAIVMWGEKIGGGGRGERKE